VPQQVLRSDVNASDFAAALAERRTTVYNYLENWPGAREFQPQDIHEGLFSYVRQRGKGHRPFLVLLACAAAGGDEMQAIPAAAAVEIYQIWTLVHDDVIDRDEIRRGAPTVQAAYAQRAREIHGLTDDAAHYGTTVAILTGDLQQSWSYALLTDLVQRGVSPAVVIELIRRMATHVTPQLLEGEMLDVQYALAPPEDLTAEQILAMLAKKSAVLLEYAAWCGARIGLGDRTGDLELADHLGKFAYAAGIAFQIRDDILGLTGDAAKLGKPVGADLREGKRTLVLHHALKRASGKDLEKLHRVIGNSVASAQEIQQAVAIITASDAIAEAQAAANKLISQALYQLDSLPDSPPLGYLRAWAHFTLAREA
jgi:geranylgeranyl diphosphate synthase type I